MSTTSAILIFIASFAISVVSSIVLAKGIDRVGARLHLRDGLLGMITALGANSPEISTAIVAILAHSHDLGIGVILGSNIFNLAGLLGLGAAVAGFVRISPQSLILNGGVAIVVAISAVAIVLHGLSPLFGLILLGVIFGLYTLLLALRPEQIDHLFSAGRISGFLQTALRSTEREVRKDQQAPQAKFTDALAIVPALTSIVICSYGMVRSAIDLGKTWHIPHRIIGLLILAALTGIPNVLTAVRLALKGRGSAAVSEALNSNSLNIFAGVTIPAVLLGLGPISHLTTYCAWWMLGMTAIVVAATFFRGGLRRWEGIGIIILYVAFVVMVLAWPQA